MEPDLTPQFRLWLERQGATLLPCKSEWEKARWQQHDLTHVLYRNKRGKYSFSSAAAEEIWEAFLSADLEEVPVEVTANVPAPTEAFVLLPATKVGLYRGADLNTADGRWIATVHHTGYDNKPNNDFDAVCRLLAAAPEMLEHLKGCVELLSSDDWKVRLQLQNLIEQIEQGPTQ
jgi:hypothetical protein